MAFEQWAVVEVMGHAVYAGRVTEEAIGGAAFLRVDVPATKDREAFTKFLGAAAIFALTPVSEAVAQQVAEQHCSRPVNVYRPQVQRALGLDRDEWTDDGDEDTD